MKGLESDYDQPWVRPVNTCRDVFGVFELTINLIKMYLPTGNFTFVVVKGSLNLF